MRTGKIMLSCFCLIMAAAQFAEAKDWRGIVPLQSTREDVIRLLGPPNTSLSDVYNLENESVTFNYSSGSCRNKVPSEWNIPPGTVVNIDVYPKKTIMLAELGIDVTKYKKSSDPHKADYFYYLSEEEGLLITTLEGGVVKSISYMPTAKDKHLKCQPSASAETAKPFYRNFDVYGDIPQDAERVRLNNFATQLRSEPKAKAYIIAYAGRRARAGEARERATRARDYLVKVCSIDPQRIIIIDGGYREARTVELFVVPPGFAPSASPTIEPSEVQIIKNSNTKFSNRRSSILRRKQRQPCP